MLAAERNPKHFDLDCERHSLADAKQRRNGGSGMLLAKNGGATMTLRLCIYYYKIPSTNR